METFWITLILAALAIPNQVECKAGKIVFFPMSAGNSPYFFFLKCAEELASRGFQTSILTTNLLRKRDSIVKHIDYTVNVTNEDLNEAMVGQSGGTKAPQGLLSVFSKLFHFQVSFCESLMQDKDALDELRSADIIFGLPVFPCNIYVAEHLDKPLILVYPGSFHLFGLFSQTPLPPSYVPIIPATDEMNFMQRVKNFLAFALRGMVADMAVQYHFGPFLKRHNMCEGMTFADAFGKAEMHIVSSHFAIDFAHPLMPNVFYVGPIMPGVAKKLPTDLDDIMESSGEHGVVIISFGSQISVLNDIIIARIATGLGMLKQTVIWKIKLGPNVVPASNVKIVDWLPQNDLLGHRNTRAFVSHMGANGAQEAAFHGVPLVAACLMSDSFQNSIRYTQRAKMAKFINVYDANASDWKNTIEEVIYNSSYKTNAMRVSRLIRTSKRTAVEKVGDLTEYLLANGGRLPHLKAAAYNLTWYQYLCLDVVIFLMLPVAIVGYVFIWLVRWACKRLCCPMSKEKMKRN